MFVDHDSSNVDETLNDNVDSVNLNANSDSENEENAQEGLENLVKKLKGDLVLSLADKENMRKRFERDSREYAKHVVNNFALSILEVVDNLELALQAAESDKNIHIGIQLVYKQILSILEGKNITQQNTQIGDEFDAQKHEILEEISSDQDKNKIAQIKAKGYMMNDKVLRHAKVSVSTGIK
ncbi:nucleotide exchange factor GrpE [Candidatus Cytomitobacter primus]|uniref:Protein GrpE n=1 Tax=Candidatus Cytomitobacter primus TaxID=2066024 RepID=A0A5C0UG37_9PROT|nr:nucleotide exchange factor GrpE [Candidatus Cytomitobacter primus]QEK38641.1 nucleotide exchange factor GrpE [Candidatus Cytomitobacter primus]